MRVLILFPYFLFFEIDLEDSKRFEEHGDSNYYNSKTLGSLDYSLAKLREVLIVFEVSIVFLSKFSVISPIVESNLITNLEFKIDKRNRDW